MNSLGSCGSSSRGFEQRGSGVDVLQYESSLVLVGRAGKNMSFCQTEMGSPNVVRAIIRDRRAGEERPLKLLCAQRAPWLLQKRD